MLLMIKDVITSKMAAGQGSSVTVNRRSGSAQLGTLSDYLAAGLTTV
jgi:hypothetical protein